MQIAYNPMKWSGLRFASKNNYCLKLNDKEQENIKFANLIHYPAIQ